jgi:ABC-type antimicrobial peptide transport system permease subunit
MDVSPQVHLSAHVSQSLSAGRGQINCPIFFISRYVMHDHHKLLIPALDFINRDFMVKNSGYTVMNYFLIKTDGKPQTIVTLTSDLAAQYKNVMPVRIQNIDTVIKDESSLLTPLNLRGLGAMERLYTIVVVSMSLAIFMLAMTNERQREFGAMRALGANLGHLRRFLFTEALAIGGLSLVIGAGVGVLLARLLLSFEKRKSHF